MSIFPRADSRLSWWKKGGVYLFMWVVWIMPAFADITDDYLNDRVREFVAAVTIIGLLLFAVAPLLGYLRFGADGWYCLLFAIGAYLIVGLLYYAQDKWGPYS